MIHDKTIRVGACDWQHAHWQGSFYPEDLPEDWQLSYYANEFSVVLVPEVRWRAEAADFDEWLDQVPQGFQFYFLRSEVKLTDSAVEVIFGDAFGGFVAPQGTDDIALIGFATKSLREWKSWLLSASCSVIFINDENLSVKQLADFKSLLELMGL